MYSRLKLKDATRSMISNNDKVLMTLEDENINILHIETDINNRHRKVFRIIECK